MPTTSTDTTDDSTPDHGGAGRLLLLHWDNGKGLDRSARIVRRVAREAGFEVTVRHVRRPGHFGTLLRDHLLTRWQNWTMRRAVLGQGRAFIREHGHKPFHVVVSLEDLHPWARRVADAVAFVPNQEWFRGAMRDARAVDVVLCKTRLAERLFRSSGCRVAYVSFTTESVACPTRTPDFGRFLHVAGRSFAKGTLPLVRAWSRHPEWPPLTVLGRGTHDLEGMVTADNIRVIDRHVTDDEKRELQATHGIHLCPSEAAGFGHTLAEGMSCGAVVATTDAAPMNELVTAERGFLIPYAHRVKQRIDARHIVAPEAIEATVRQILNEPVDRLRARGVRAREWFRDNDRFFVAALAAELRSLATCRHP